MSRWPGGGEVGGKGEGEGRGPVRMTKKIKHGFNALMLKFEVVSTTLYNTTLLSLRRGICLPAGHLDKTFDAF